MLRGRADASNQESVAVCVGAATESFWRAKLNAVLNKSVTGAAGSAFRHMPLQVTVRMAYMNGLKKARHAISAWCGGHGTPWWSTVAVAIGPGLVMTPASSLLEAAVVPSRESIAVQWRHGLLPRAAREVLFGVGLNEASDVCQSLVPDCIHNPMLRTWSGSIVAGIMSGYLSQVPHNLSTLKLVEPGMPYSQHVGRLMDHARAAYPTIVHRGLTPSMERTAAFALAVLLPKGALWRSVSIAGTYLIMNTVLYSLREDPSGSVRLSKLLADTEELELDMWSTPSLAVPEPLPAPSVAVAVAATTAATSPVVTPAAPV